MHQPVEKLLHAHESGPSTVAPDSWARQETTADRHFRLFPGLFGGLSTGWIVIRHSVNVRGLVWHDWLSDGPVRAEWYNASDCRTSRPKDPRRWLTHRSSLSR